MTDQLKQKAKDFYPMPQKVKQLILSNEMLNLLQRNAFENGHEAGASKYTAIIQQKDQDIARYKKALKEIQFLVDRHSGWDAGKFLEEISSMITNALKPI